MNNSTHHQQQGRGGVGTHGLNCSVKTIHNDTVTTLLKGYDAQGAMVFSIVVIAMYGLFITLLIGGTFRRNRDDDLKSFLRSYEEVSSNKKKYSKMNMTNFLRRFHKYKDSDHATPMMPNNPLSSLAMGTFFHPEMLSAVRRQSVPAVRPLSPPSAHARPCEVNIVVTDFSSGVEADLQEETETENDSYVSLASSDCGAYLSE